MRSEIRVQSATETRDSNQRGTHLYNYAQTAGTRYRCVVSAEHQNNVSTCRTVSDNHRIALVINPNSILRRTTIQHGTIIKIAVNINAYGEGSYNHAPGTAQNS